MGCTVVTPAGGAFKAEIVEEAFGLVVFRVWGKDAWETFAGEGGSVCWQRVSPTDKKGRIQTSNVTVAVLREPEAAEAKIAEKDLEWTTTIGSGPGGQYRNKTESCVVLKHLPTGLVVKCETERSQKQNKDTALAVLSARLLDRQQKEANAKMNKDRRAQVGTGGRGERNRTLRFKDDIAADHRTGKKMSLRRYLDGELEGLQ